jgi:hypothetical protein
MDGAVRVGMNRTSVVLVATLASVAARPAPVAAQARPDFAGRWACDQARSTSSCSSSAMVVEQDSDRLKVRRDETNAVVQTYRLDGTETINDPMQEFGFTGRKLPQMRDKARWEASGLAIESRTIEATPAVTREVWSLSVDGRELAIEATRSGARTGTSKTVYTRSASPRDDILAASQRWRDAFLRGDPDTMAAIETEDLVIIDNGVMRDRSCCRPSVAGDL